jgi:hypothetical protein
MMEDNRTEGRGLVEARFIAPLCPVIIVGFTNKVIDVARVKKIEVEEKQVMSHPELFHTFGMTHHLLFFAGKDRDPLTRVR